MLLRLVPVAGLCLFLAACGGMSMDGLRGEAASAGSSGGGGPTSYESGYGVRSGSAGSSAESAGNMDWGE